MASNRLFGITYCGIGLSFAVASCQALGCAHNVLITNISNSAELEETLTAEFNELMLPVAVDVEIGFSSSDYTISAVFSGDSDGLPSDSLMKFRTMTASAVVAEDVKGSVLTIHLTPRGSESDGRAAVRIIVDVTPFRAQTIQRQEHE
jgi:hypothetical protein